MPFIHDIQPRWGDCDPAGIVFTPRIPWFAVEAIDAWWTDLLGGGFYHIENDRNTGTPFVHMSLDFSSPITPRHLLNCEVAPVRIGRASIEFRVTGRQDGRECFQGRFVCAFVVPGVMKAAPPPDDLRRMIEARIAAAE